MLSFPQNQKTPSVVSGFIRIPPNGRWLESLGGLEHRHQASEAAPVDASLVQGEDGAADGEALASLDCLPGVNTLLLGGLGVTVVVEESRATHLVDTEPREALVGREGGQGGILPRGLGLRGGLLLQLGHFCSEDEGCLWGSVW